MRENTRKEEGGKGRNEKKIGRERKERKRASYLVSDNFASFVHGKYVYHDTYFFPNGPLCLTQYPPFFLLINNYVPYVWIALTAYIKFLRWRDLPAKV